MKKILIIIVAIAIVGIIAGLVMGLINKTSSDTNDNAEKDEEGRYLTIINDTNQVINEVHITVGSGTEIESMRRTNPDETSFSIEIPDEYSEYTSFTITLVDRYEMKYQKEIADVKSKGRTEVKISKEDYTKEKGDIWHKIDQFFNGD